MKHWLVATLFAVATFPARAAVAQTETNLADVGQVESLQSYEGCLLAGTRPSQELSAAVYASADGTDFDDVTSAHVPPLSIGNPRSLRVFNGDLYLMGNRSEASAAVWRTSVCPSAGGNNWSSLVTNAFGDSRNLDLPAHAEFQTRLYVGTRADATIGAEIWRSADGTTWTPSVGGNPTPMGQQPEGFGDPNNKRIGELVVFKDQLYAAARNDVTGVQVWRSPDGIAWTQVVGPSSSMPGGFGNTQNTSVFASAIFSSHLYLGIKHQGGSTGDAEIWRTPDGTTWISVDPNGFGNSNNTGIDVLQVAGGRLFAGTINAVDGAELWESSDGLAFTPVVTAGFEDPDNNERVRSLTIYLDQLYIGLGNGLKGSSSRGQLWAAVTQIQFCGDGLPDPGEECDDGNNQDGDGCSADCLNEACLTLGGDSDGDSVCDDEDNCPFVSNPGQEDCCTPGDQENPDGIGDACQCGDVTGDGQANSFDATMIKRQALSLSAPLFNLPKNCDVTGDGACNSSDATMIIRKALGLSAPLFGDNCSNFTGEPGEF